VLAFKMKACFNLGMDSKQIIDALGGPSAVAKLCDVKPQSVSQWFGSTEDGRIRKIPRSRLMYLKVIRPKVFKELQAQTEAA
jgi:DNA-binding transcriptional regulator YdaS (Cro superfamily)